MIVFRYLAKELLLTTLVVTLLLVAIFLSNQFVRLLSQIAAGQLAINILLHLLLLEVPILLGYLLPVGFFISILLTYGRMYADSEMTVLRSCGYGQSGLLKHTLIIGFPLAVLVAVLVMWLIPHMIAVQETAMAEKGAQLLLETIVPGRFQPLHQGKQIFYIEGLSHDRKQLNGIFMAQHVAANKQHKKARWVITTSAYAAVETDRTHAKHLIAAHNGYRYDGLPGQNNFDVVHFSRYDMVLPDNQNQRDLRVKALPTSTIWRGSKTHSLDFDAEWQWRLALPMSVIFLIFLGVPISRVNPRQGKFAKILPATLIYIIYANMLFVCRDWIEEGIINPHLGMWVVHGPLILLAAILLLRNDGWGWILPKVIRKRR